MFCKSGTWVSVTAVLTLAILVCVNNAEGQSNFDVEPPIQADLNSQQVIMSPDPGALPTFKFAVAEVNDDGNITVATAGAKQTLLANEAPPDPRMEVFTENVTQDYTVMVPYQEKLADGKVVTKTRAEKRSRTVAVQKFRARKLTPEQLEKIKTQEENDKKEGKLDNLVKTEMVATPYNVTIPFIVTIDGKQVTRYRQETRMRTVQVKRGNTKTEREETTESYPVSKLKAFAVDGKPIQNDDLKKRLADRTPVIIIGSEKAISPYFRALLKPDVIFLICPN